MAASGNINRHFLDGVSNKTQNQSPYSQEELSCHGRACAQCGKCRDWYWIHDPSGYGAQKFYMKRADATCTGSCGGLYDNQYDYDGCFGGGSYYHFFFGCCCFGRHCECDDNQC